ncbi:MAG: PilZ domain-containing protein [Thermotogaceae bacterium]|nr:PilZ domain-containing protein [Thermotogaceae bacterium]
MAERRKHKRVAFKAEGFCALERGKAKFIIITRDISPQGLGFTVFSKIEEGEDIDIEIPVRIELSLDKKVLKLKGTLVWRKCLSLIRRFKAGAFIKEIEPESKSYIEKYCNSHLSLSRPAV